MASDISMCMNDTCPLRETCYRFKATPEPLYQAYAGFKYETKEDGEVYCDGYWKLSER